MADGTMRLWDSKNPSVFYDLKLKDLGDGTVALAAVDMGVAPSGVGAAPTSYKNLGAVSAAFIKAAAGNVFSLMIINRNAAIRYLQLHNKATIPLAGETAQESFPIPAGTAAQPGILVLDQSYFAPSAYFATGIGFAISTTEATFTDTATPADHSVRVRYS